jgi:hypothetical protein
MARMTSYKILNLNNQTSDVERARLGSRLRAVPGVNVVTISADRGEISLSFRANEVVAKDVLASAIETAGFVLDQRSNPWVR